MKKETKKKTSAGKAERQAHQVFHALAAPPRRTILRHLAASGLTAGEIASHFDMAKPSISQHLSILENAGLITREKRGQYVHYALVPGILETVLRGFLKDLGVANVATADKPDKPGKADIVKVGEAKSGNTGKAANSASKQSEAAAEPAEKTLPTQMSMF